MGKKGGRKESNTPAHGVEGPKGQKNIVPCLGLKWRGERKRTGIWAEKPGTSDAKKGQLSDILRFNDSSPIPKNELFRKWGGGGKKWSEDGNWLGEALQKPLEKNNATLPPNGGKRRY